MTSSRSHPGRTCTFHVHVPRLQVRLHKERFEERERSLREEIATSRSMGSREARADVREVKSQLVEVCASEAHAAARMQRRC